MYLLTTTMHMYSQLGPTAYGMIGVFLQQAGAGVGAPGTILGIHLGTAHGIAHGTMAGMVAGIAHGTLAGMVVGTEAGTVLTTIMVGVVTTIVHIITPTVVYLVHVAHIPMQLVEEVQVVMV